MDTFRNISWKVPVDIETNFATAEEFKTMSVALKVLHGTFKTELSSDSSDESPLPARKNNKKTGKKKRGTNPNLKKTSFKKTEGNVAVKCVLDNDGKRVSSFTAKQHDSIVNTLWAMQNRMSTNMSEWMEVKEAVLKEQTECLNEIRELWKSAYEKHHVLPFDAKKFTEECWKMQLGRVKLYPQFYSPLRKIPLVYSSDKPDVLMLPIKVLLEMGVLPKLYLPCGSASSKICADYCTMLRLNSPTPEDANTLFNKPVSCDRNAEILAVRERADVVISSSSLKCIATNISSTLNREWIIPLVARQYSIKDGSTERTHQVVYVDKKLPSKTMSVHERNAWYHKLAIKNLMCHHRDPTSFRYPDNTNFELSHNGEIYSRNEFLDFGKDVSCNRDLSSEPLLEEETTSQNTFINDYATCNNDKNISQTIIPPPSKTNVTYRLWKINYEERKREDLNEKLMKGLNFGKEIKVLVRCKIDACEHENENTVPVCLSCKLEYQAEYGAEKMNLSSLIKEWTALFFRPEAMLRRIRIDAMTEEILMTEKLALRELSQMVLHLHNVSLRKNVLGSLYQVFLDLITLKPGGYILMHDLRSGAFASVLQHTSKNNNFDLYTEYESVDPSILNNDIPQWIPIDTSLITPRNLLLKQIPATFQPAKQK